jgi:hypothetical protein
MVNRVLAHLHVMTRKDLRAVAQAPHAHVPRAISLMAPLVVNNT